MSRALSSMSRELGLVDVWRSLNPNSRDFTFRSHVHGSYTRIDLIYVWKKELYRVKECRIEPITISDHGPVIMKINLGLEPHFRHWRLNVSLLTDSSARQEIENAITEYFAINVNCGKLVKLQSEAQLFLLGLGWRNKDVQNKLTKNRKLKG